MSATYDGRRSRYQLGSRVTLKTAWFATPDNRDAVAASSNVCSVSALAFVSRTYETTHGEPDGLLPEIRRHACSEGFAIAVFIQEAPPPGYEASLAFAATPGGWTVLGTSDFIEPGQFAIPEAAYSNMMSQLAFAPNSESVAF